MADGYPSTCVDPLSKSIFAVIETCQEYHATKEETALKLIEKFSLAKEEALALVEEHWH